MIPLASNASSIAIKGATFFWLDRRTLARVSEADGIQTLEAFNITCDPLNLSVDLPLTIGTLPKGAAADNFQYAHGSGMLVFSSSVYADYDLSTVAEQDEAYKERGTTAYVFDNTFVRHWDTWRGPKKSRLFSIELTKGDNGWKLGNEFYRPLLDTEHVSVPSVKTTIFLDKFLSSTPRLNLLVAQMISQSARRISCIRPRILQCQKRSTRAKTYILSLSREEGSLNTSQLDIKVRRIVRHSALTGIKPSGLSSPKMDTKVTVHVLYCTIWRRTSGSSSAGTGTALQMRSPWVHQALLKPHEITEIYFIDSFLIAEAISCSLLVI